MRAGLGVGVGERADQAGVERADVLVDQLRRRAQHDRLHGAHVHHVTHRRRGAAVARDRLARHRERDVVLAEAAVLLRHGQREEAVLAEQLEVAARIEQLVVGALRVRAHLLLAQLDQRRAELLLAVGQDPVRVPVVAEAPERLGSPHLLGHPYLRRRRGVRIMVGGAFRWRRRAGRASRRTTEFEEALEDRRARWLRELAGSLFDRAHEGRRRRPGRGDA